MKTTLTADEIKHMLPHRWPFLLLDRVTEVVPDKYAVGLKNVTISEPFFEGHFPQRAIMPGVLIVEALAQLTAIVYCSGHLARAEAERSSAAMEDMAAHVGYLVLIKNMKFAHPVEPGDQLILRSTVSGGHGLFSQVRVSASVGSRLVVEGMLGVTQAPGAEQEEDTREAYVGLH